MEDISEIRRKMKNQDVIHESEVKDLNTIIIIARYSGYGNANKGKREEME